MIDLIHKKADHYYFLYQQTGRQVQSKLYRIKKKSSYRIDSNDFTKGTEVVLDPDELSDDEERIYIKDHVWSQDGKYLAYEVEKVGSIWSQLRIRCMKTLQDLKDKLDYVKFNPCIAWTHDNKGFFYSRYDKTENVPIINPNKIYQNQKIYYHKIGTT